MTIQVTHLVYDHRKNPESRDAYLDLSGFLKIEFLKEVMRNPEEWVAKGISYQLVAEVASNDLERAFELTNHIHCSWTENDGVRLMTTDRVRSSSMGDIFVKDGKTYVVASFGFKEIVL